MLSIKNKTNRSERLYNTNISNLIIHYKKYFGTGILINFIHIHNYYIECFVYTFIIVKLDNHNYFKIKHVVYMGNLFGFVRC